MLRSVHDVYVLQLRSRSHANAEQPARASQRSWHASSASRSESSSESAGFPLGDLALRRGAHLADAGDAVLLDAAARLRLEELAPHRARVAEHLVEVVGAARQLLRQVARPRADARARRKRLGVPRLAPRGHVVAALAGGKAVPREGDLLNRRAEEARDPRVRRAVLPRRRARRPELERGRRRRRRRVVEVGPRVPPVVGVALRAAAQPAALGAEPAARLRRRAVAAAEGGAAAVAVGVARSSAVGHVLAAEVGALGAPFVHVGGDDRRGGIRVERREGLRRAAVVREGARRVQEVVVHLPRGERAAVDAHPRDVAVELDVVPPAVECVRLRAVADEAVALAAAADVAAGLRVERRRLRVAIDREDSGGLEDERRVVPAAVGERRPRGLVVIVALVPRSADGEAAIVGAQEEVERLRAIEVDERPVLEPPRALLRLAEPAVRLDHRLRLADGAGGKGLAVLGGEARLVLEGGADAAVGGAAARVAPRDRRARLPTPEDVARRPAHERGAEPHLHRQRRDPHARREVEPLDRNVRPLSELEEGRLPLLLHLGRRVVARPRAAVDAVLAKLADRVLGPRAAVVAVAVV